MDVADILLLDSWAIHVPKLTLEGQVERHILELMATDQAAEIRQLGSENVLKTLVFRMSTGGLYHLKQKHLLKRHVFAWKDRLHVSSTTSCNILNRWWRHWCWDIFWVKKKKKKSSQGCFMKRPATLHISSLRNLNSLQVLFAGKHRAFSIYVVILMQHQWI